MNGSLKSHTHLLFVFLCYKDEFGLLPRRKPVFIVIGKPIHVEKVEGAPTTEQLQDLQKKYIDEVLEIWDRYKDRYAVGRTQELQIIE